MQIPSFKGGVIKGWSMRTFGVGRALYGCDERDWARPMLNQRGADWADLPQQEDCGIAVPQPNVYMGAEAAIADQPAFHTHRCGLTCHVGWDTTAAPDSTQNTELPELDGYSDEDVFYNNTECMLSNYDTDDRIEGQIQGATGAERSNVPIDPNSVKHVYRDEMWTVSMPLECFHLPGTLMV